ncbi:MAG: VWA domain-containing protein [Balneolaceae bacterium]
MKFRYEKWKGDRFDSKNSTPFDSLWDLFKQLLSLSGGEVEEAVRWLTELDQEYEITKQFGDGYGIGDFLDELEKRGYLRFDDRNQQLVPTRKAGQSIRKSSLEELFSDISAGQAGQHPAVNTGKGTERQPETRLLRAGDDYSRIDASGTVLNVLRHSSLDRFDLREDDISVHETDHNTSTSTVLLIDLSHSMILYGEDRITPAKKVAMALSELITTRFSGDSLDLVAFGNKAWKIETGELPWLTAGPWHTNTLEALQMARHTLQRRKNRNRQIIMITDGKPSCMIENGKFYRNSYGLDRKIVNRVINEAVLCKKEKITITTFMIAQDPYLQSFVRELSDANRGRAYFASPDRLGGYILHDYINNRIRNIR